MDDKEDKESNIIPLNVGKPKNKKVKTGQDARRWRRFEGLLRDGVVRLLGVGGVALKTSEVDEFIDTLDDIIELEDKAANRERMRKQRRRSKAKVKEFRPKDD